MITWEFYSKRRKIHLGEFLANIENYQDALALFRQRSIEPPRDLNMFFSSQEEKVESKAPPQKTTASKKAPPKKSSPKKTPPKKTTTKKRSTSKVRKVSEDDLLAETGVPLNSEETSTDAEEKVGKKPYFRKIIKPEKK